jgi:hypothetical protein
VNKSLRFDRLYLESLKKIDYSGQDSDGGQTNGEEKRKREKHNGVAWR